MKRRYHLSIALSLAVMAGCSGTSESPKRAAQASDARTVSVAQTVLRPMSGTFTASGLLIPREEAAVGSELSGFAVQHVLVEEGANVKKGQILARLDAGLLKSKLAQASANVTQAKAQAAVRVAQAQLNDLRTQSNRMVIRAPVAGTVLERNVRPGEVSAAGQPLFRIARDGLIELDAEIPEDQLAQLTVGTKAQVFLPSGHQASGSVRLVSPRVDPQTKLGRLRVAHQVTPRPGAELERPTVRFVQEPEIEQSPAPVHPAAHVRAHDRDGIEHELCPFFFLRTRPPHALHGLTCCAALSTAGARSRAAPTLIGAA